MNHENDMTEETKCCPYCGETILATAQKCKHCGEWLTPRVDERKNWKDVVNEFHNYETMRNGWGCLFWEIVLLAIAVGLSYQSWWAFLIALCVLFMLLSLRFLNTLLCIALSVVWGILGMFIGEV